MDSFLRPACATNERDGMESPQMGRIFILWSGVSLMGTIVGSVCFFLLVPAASQELFLLLWGIFFFHFIAVLVFFVLPLEALIRKTVLLGEDWPETIKGWLPLGWRVWSDWLGRKFRDEQKARFRLSDKAKRNAVERDTLRIHLSTSRAALDQARSQLECWRGAVDTMSWPVAGTGPAGRIRMWNKEAALLFGVAEERVLGHPLWDVIAPGQRDLEKRILAMRDGEKRIEACRSVEGGQDTVGLLRLPSPHPEIAFLICFLDPPVPMEPKTAAASIAVVAEAAPVGLFVATGGDEPAICYMNPHLRSLLDPEMRLPVPLSNRIHPEDLAAMAKLQPEDGLLHRTCRVRSMEGKWLDIGISLAALKSTTGDEGVAAYAGLLDSAPSADAMADGKDASLTDAVVQSLEGVALLDRNGRYCFANPVFEVLAGKTRGGMIGKPFEAMFPKSQREPRRDRLRETLRLKESWTGRYTRTDGGRLQVMEARISPVENEMGEITNHVVVLRDLTREVEGESRLAEVEKLEALRALSEGISHDFNNILSLVIGFSEMGLHEITMGAEGARTHLENIRDAGLRAKDLVRQIATFTRAGEMDAPVTVNQVVQETLQLLRTSLPRSIEIWDNVSETGLGMTPYPDRLRQVLVGLCMHGATAIGRRPGILQVSLEACDGSELPAGLPPGPCCRLKISDTGEGIGQEQADRMLLQDSEGDRSGLSALRGLVRRMQGLLSIRSLAGKGTTVTVLLPVVTGEPVEKGHHPDVRILFVDDEKSLLELAGQMFNRFGITTDTFRSPIKALERFRMAPDVFDVVITDMDMPEMTGDHLAQEIRKIKADTPIILSTGYATEITEEAARAAGIDVLLPKPMGSAQMMAAVARVLGLPNAVLAGRGEEKKIS